MQDQPKLAPGFLIACGIIGLLGALSLILGNIIGSMMVPGHDWIADTISDLAAGKYEIIQDVALYGFAAGLLALANGAAHFHTGAIRWSLGIVGLLILAGLVIVIGARNEYGDNDDAGVVIHIYLVYGLGIGFAVVPCLFASGLRRINPTLARLALVAAGLWTLTAPFFLFLPTDIDGLWERGLGLIAVLFVGTFASALIQRGRQAS